MIRTSLAFIALAGVAAASVGLTLEPAPPQTTEVAPAAAPIPENLRQVLETFRSDLNAAKIRTINQSMELTAAEAAKFWPIYQRYETELSAVTDRRIEVLTTFVKLSADGGLSDDNANDIAEKSLQLAQDRLDLWKKYHKEISAGVSPVRGAQFLQVEHQIALLVDMNIASEMPRVEGATQPR
jgi:hypothetical protein